MKTKLEMAHEWALKNMFKDEYSNMTAGEFTKKSFEYADAMQAEADKREKEETCDKSLNIDSKELNVEDWQPDWSQAPEWANWWAMDLDLVQAHWYEVEPSIDAITWRRRTRTCKQAPSFGYTGDWRNSLRKRPN